MLLPVQLAKVVDSEEEAEQDRHDPQEVEDVVSEWGAWSDKPISYN